jgi:hypothetical protein
MARADEFLNDGRADEARSTNNEDTSPSSGLAKADFSAKRAALRQRIIVSLLCGVSTVHDDVLACDKCRTG